MLNKVILMGRLTNNIELKRTKAGKAAASFSLAVSRDYKDDRGEIPCDFIDCVVFDRTAEFASKYFSKGDMATVVGRLQKRQWKAKDGSNRYNTEVMVSDIYFGGGKKKEEKSTQYEGSYFQEDEADGELPW